MVVESPPCTASCFSPGIGESRTFWETTAPQALQPLPGHRVLVLTSFLVIAPLLFQRNPYFRSSSDAAPHFEHQFSTTRQMLLVPINLQNNFSCLSRVLDFKAVLHCEEGCATVLQRSRGRAQSGQPCCAGLGLPAGKPLPEHSWFPSPRYRRLFLFGREYRFSCCF